MAHLTMQGTLSLALEGQWFIQTVTCDVHVLHQALSGAVRVTFTKASAVHPRHVSSSDKP